MLTKLSRIGLMLLACQLSYHANADIPKALQHEVRAEQHKTRDAVRKPEQTLTFFEVTP